MLAFRRLWMTDRERIFGEYPRTSELVRECPESKYIIYKEKHTRVLN